MFNLTLSSEFGNTGKLILHSYCTSVLWSIDKKGYLLTSITCPYRGLRCQPIEVDHFFEVIRWQVTSLKWSQAVSFFSFWFHMKYVVFMCRAFKILISNWPWTRLFSQLLTFLTMVTRWSRSSSNVYTLIGQNLIGEFIRKIYASSWNLFTLTAEADRVLCQRVLFLTVFFHWMYKLKFSSCQESSVIHG